MERLRRFILPLLGLWSAVVSAANPPNPICQGKKLSQWFDEFSETPAYITPASKAIQSLGAEAVPYLIQFLKPTETNSWRKRAALAALDHLGTKAGAAVPALIQCLDDEDLKVEADAAYTLPKIGAKAKVAIPRLKDYLKQHGDAYNGLAAAVALWRLDKQQAPVVVPAVTKMLLAEGHFDFDANVIDFLAEIGPPAYEAIPVLGAGLKEVSFAEDRELIREAIEKIQVKKKEKP